jgi:hypothetical protein
LTVSDLGPPSRASASPICLRQDVAWREIEGDIVVLDLTGAAYYSVSASGVVLWPSLVEGCTLDQLTDRLVERFSIDRQVAERDVRAFIETLSGEGLLEAGG